MAGVRSKRRAMAAIAAIAVKRNKKIRKSWVIGVKLAAPHRHVNQESQGPRRFRQMRGCYSALAAILTVSASNAVLYRKEAIPCTVAVRRITLSVTPTSDTCAVMPMTKEK